MIKKKEEKERASEERTYCPWCVTEEEKLRLQRLGYVSQMCDAHQRQLLIDAGITPE